MAGFLRAGAAAFDFPKSVQDVYAEVKRALIEGGHLAEQGIWFVILDSFDDETARRALQVRTNVRSAFVNSRTQVVSAYAGRYATRQTAVEKRCTSTRNLSASNEQDGLFQRALHLPAQQAALQVPATGKHTSKQRRWFS